MAPKRIVRDANLLVLLVVGIAEPKYISKHKRLNAYQISDFKRLKNMISVSAGIVVTPNVLSEASNLLRQINEPARGHIGRAFRNFIRITTEIYVKSCDASAREEFLHIGLSDSAILEICKDDIVVLSADSKLCRDAEKAGYTAKNYNHFRDVQ